MSDMGTFRTDIEIENPARPGERQLIRSALVDTGSELTWIPAPMLESIGIVEDKRVRFRLANGVVVERRFGLARRQPRRCRNPLPLRTPVWRSSMVSARLQPRDARDPPPTR